MGAGRESEGSEEGQAKSVFQNECGRSYAGIAQGWVKHSFPLMTGK